MNPPKVINQILTLLVCTGAGLCIVCAGVVVRWVLDRDAPFVMLDYSAPAVKPGQSTVIKAFVKRDLSRRCSVLFSRVFYDSAGTRFELTDGAQLMNSSALESYNRRSPDVLAFAVAVPGAAAPGHGTVMTVLDYQCNPTHQLYPIDMVLVMDLEVLEEKH